MARKRFRSKIDRWILILLVATIVLELAVTTWAATALVNPWTATGTIVAGLLVIAFIGSLLARTHYTVEGNELTIVSGPFRWRVPLDRIHHVEATKNPLSSPALSLDRLRIHYGNNRRVMISPADRNGFLKAIGQTPE